MKASDVVTGAGYPGFTTNSAGTILDFNRAAELILGYGRREAIGRRCYDLLCGRDQYGNRFCQKDCAIRAMARRRETVSPFSLTVASASGEPIDVRVLIVAQDERDNGCASIAHLIQPGIVSGPGLSRVRSRGRHSGVTRFEPEMTTDDPPGALAFGLTKREIEVLRLLAQGKNCAEISRVLMIAMATARNHIRNILRKLDVHSQAEAISFTYRNGLL